MKILLFTAVYLSLCAQASAQGKVVERDQEAKQPDLQGAATAHAQVAINNNRDPSFPEGKRSQEMPVRIGPGGATSFSITHHILANFEPNSGRAAIFGCVRYKDIFGCERETWFGCDIPRVAGSYGHLDRLADERRNTYS